MKQITIKVLIILLLSSPNYLMAQAPNYPPIIDRITPPEPESGNISAYGNYNLNLASGQVNIEVPIYTMKGNTIEYPLKLNYDHSGIKVVERANSAGMNWSFSVGVINRNIVGVPDETTKGYNYHQSQIPAFEGYFSSGIYTPSDLLTDPVYLNATGRTELLPDIYNYSFNGMSGQFFYDVNANKYFTMPYSTLKITGDPTSTSGFQIIDDKGYVYKFNKIAGNNVSSECYSTDFSEGPLPYNGQWYLTEIDNPDDNVEFTFGYDLYNTFDIISPTEQKVFFWDWESYKACCTNTSLFDHHLINDSHCYSENSYQGYLLTKITSATEIMQVGYELRSDVTSTYRMKTMSLFKSDGITSKQSWEFYHTYFPPGNNKLKLDSITLFSPPYNRESSYSFEYEGSNIPNINSNAQDHWGFYNGAIANTSLIPLTIAGGWEFGTANRDPNFMFAQCGILQKIKYPTGGTTSFEYELNNYSFGSEEYFLSNGSEEVSTPVYTPMTFNKTRHYDTDGGDGSSYAASFTLLYPTQITYSTYVAECDLPSAGVTYDCGPEYDLSGGYIFDGSGSIVHALPATVMGHACTSCILGTAKTGSGIFLLNPGTYKLGFTTSVEHNWGHAEISLNPITGWNNITNAGGLRIKSIKNYDQYNDITSTKTFKYIDADHPTLSSGVNLAEPCYAYISSRGYACGGCGVGGSDIGGGCNEFQYELKVSSNSIYQLNFSNGQSVSYKRVIESFGASGEGGYIDHRFSYEPDDDTNIRNIPFPPASPRFWKRGLPIQTFYYSSGGVLISSDQNVYEEGATAPYDQIIGIKTGFQSQCPLDAMPNIILPGFFDYTSEWYRLKSNTKTSYFPGSSPLAQETDYYYDNPLHLLPTRLVTTKSDGNTITKYTKYPADYSPLTSSSDPMISALNNMVSKNMHQYPIEETETITSGGIEKITGSTLNTYQQFYTGKYYPWQTFKLNISSPMSMASLSSIVSGAFQHDINYENREEVNSYNTIGKPLQVTEDGNAVSSFIWTYGQYSFSTLHGTQFLTAKVKNAQQNMIAYTSFETNETGNWLYSISSSSIVAGGVTGQNCYNLSTGSISISGLPTGNYIVSYWINSGSATVNGAGPTSSGNSVSGWTYKEHVISSVSAVTILGSGTIDEVRLYPQSAQMETFSYDPAIGVTHKCDVNNLIKQYKYDNLSRLQLILDQKGNIEKKYEYGIQKPE